MQLVGTLGRWTSLLVRQDGGLMETPLRGRTARTEEAVIADRTERPCDVSSLLDIEELEPKTTSAFAFS